MRAPSAKQVADRMSKVREGLQPFVGRVLSEADILKLIVLVCKATYRLPKQTIEQTNAAYATLAHLVGKAWSTRQLAANLTRLVANWHFVYEGMRVPEWEGEPTDADILFIGVGKRLVKLPGGQMGRTATVKLKTGLGAGIISCVALLKRTTELFLEHESGAATLDCPFEEIAGMEARTTVRLNQDGTFSFGRLTTSDSQRKHNRELALRRSDTGKCSAGIPCNLCQMDVAQCPLAVWSKEENNG